MRTSDKFQNMSDIKESIEEYSANFDTESRPVNHSISEHISLSQSREKQLIKAKKQIPSHNPSHNPSQKEDATTPHLKDSNVSNQPPKTTYSTAKFNDLGNIPEQNPNKPIFLGSHIFTILRDKYYEINKVITNEDQVLYDFYLSRRKNFRPSNTVNPQNMVPSARRKLELKQQFQTILGYRPEDIQYSLIISAEGQKTDNQIKAKMSLFQEVKKKEVKKISKPSQRLYMTSTKALISGDDIAKIQREEKLLFGRRLSQAYQNTHRQAQTHEALLKYWHEIDREAYNLDWDGDTVSITIRQYMYGQIAELKALYHRKMGYKQKDGRTLFQFLLANQAAISIPPNSFEAYVKIYNSQNLRIQAEAQQREEQLQFKRREENKRKDYRQFGRPVSATPLSKLAEPKKSQAYGELISKFSSDKMIKTLVQGETLKRARYPFEYGVYNIEEEIKIKQRIKINEGNMLKNRDRLMQEYLEKTYCEGKFFNLKDYDRVSSILNEEDLHKNEKWKELSPVLLEAILVKSHQEKWLRSAVLVYLNKTPQNETPQYALQDDKHLYSELIKHLTALEQNNRGHALESLLKIIEQQQRKVITPKEKTNISKEIHEKICQKAREFLRRRHSNSQEERQFSLREFLSEMFNELRTNHQKQVHKLFHVVSTEKQCPKLLKYEFFRIIKEIDLLEMGKDAVIKSHAWIPGKNKPQSFNYKTYNRFGEIYADERGAIIDAKPEEQKWKKSIWGRKMGKQREKIMMTYDDAKECTFNPQISKKTH